MSAQAASRSRTCRSPRLTDIRRRLAIRVRSRRFEDLRQERVVVDGAHKAAPTTSVINERSDASVIPIANLYLSGASLEGAPNQWLTSSDPFPSRCAGAATGPPPDAGTRHSVEPQPQRPSSLSHSPRTHH